MVERVSPVVRGRRLAAELRRLRTAAGLTIEQVAVHLECSTAKLSRIENGQVGVRIQDAREMLDLYGVEEPQRESLLGLVRQARGQGWWHAYANLLPAGMQTYVGLEDEARGIRIHNIGLVPGLVQTARYAEAVNGAFTGLSGPEAQRHTELRLGRQRILTRPDPVRLHLVIDESALSRRVGGPETMAEQYRHLVEIGGLDNVTLQVLTFSAGVHQSAAFSYNIVSFADAADPDVVYVGMLNDCLYRTEPEQVAWYDAAFGQAVATALSPGDSLRHLTRLAEA